MHYAEAHVHRAKLQSEARAARRQALLRGAAAAARALTRTFGDGISVFVFGSVLDQGRFRIDSDLDIAVRGIPLDHYYMAWRVADEAVTGARVDLVHLESSPEWLIDEVETNGERLP